MPEPSRAPAASSVITAAICAFATIATQVAGKATRDALFLTNFHISALPIILMASAAISIGVVLVVARWLALAGPSRVIPPMFFASGILLTGEWLLALRDPGLASILIYLHIAVVGAILISGFWSIINEHFDPRSARRNIGRIVGGATVGGLFGGFLADRLGAAAGILWVLPVIAGLQMLCALLLPRLRSSQAAGERVALRALFPGGDRQPRGESGFQVLRRVAYVRNLAFIVLLGNVAATLIDYLFKARAAESFPGSADLVHFFAIFYTAVSLLTLAVQAGMTRHLLERFGIANTMAVRPAIVTVGGLLAMPWMGIADLGILRGIEAVAQSSFFRSGYELLFTPVVPDDKRRAKTIVDVGADRMGDIVGALLIRGIILLPAAISGRILLVLAMAISLVGYSVARRLRRGYVHALEGSLIDRAQRLDLDAGGGPGTRTTAMETFAGIDLSLSADDVELKELRDAAAASDTTPPSAPAAPASVPTDPEVALIVELRSGDPTRVAAALRATRTMSPAVASQVVSLLAWDQVTGWAS
ncbi:MAG TPA: Npt1/Npt2 family nucleotide transporter, partial [Candidatus Krumholzibacteria bacterium]|nr:Npt1/Npt2 family nucleotide transporter [Candidatus Krumholzibacteria bacterium]